MRRSFLFTTLAGFIACLGSPLAFGLPITITDINHFATVRDGTRGLDRDTDINPIPFVSSVEISLGESSAESQVNLTESSISHHFSGSIDNTDNTDTSIDSSDSAQAISRIGFTADVSSAYSITGFIYAENPPLTTFDIQIDLFDYTSGFRVLYFLGLDTFIKENEQFIIGSLNPGHYRYFETSGDLFGNLIAGHQYLFESEINVSDLIPNGPVSNVAAHMYGNVTLTYSVPEPGTLTLFGIGLAGMGLAGRRKKV